MKCIILAAGYATRLYPLTENFPKPLLDVNGKNILDWIIDDIKSNIEEFIIISNHKFYNHFISWSKTKDVNIKVLDDNTISNETRLGAVIDIKFVLDNININDDTLIIAGDNLLDFSLNKFIEFSKIKDSTCTMCYFESNLEKIKKSSELIIDDNTDKILEMNEKPVEPKSNWCCPAFYFYKKNDLYMINNAIESGIKTDAPGSLLSYMVKHTNVYAYRMPGSRYDIGTLESYEKIKKEYKGYVK